MFCTNCGKEVPDDSDFCTYCGRKIEHEEDLEKTIEVSDEEEEAEGEEIYCTNCGQKLSSSDRFCTACGTSVSGEREHGEKDVLSVKDASMVKTGFSKSFGKIFKIGGVAVAALCVVGIAGFGISRLLASPKSRVAKSLSKTLESALNKDTGINYFLGLDDMIEELEGGRTQQVLDFSAAGTVSFEAELLSDAKSDVSMVTVTPSFAGMGVGDIILYQNGERIYLGIPDALDDVVYLDLETAKKEYSDSFLGKMIEEYTGEDLADYLPDVDEEKSLISYGEYCREPLKDLYDAMEVKKDGKRRIDIGGKQQNCTQYQVLLPQKQLTALFEASADYVDEVLAQGSLSDVLPVWNELVRSFEIEDMEMTLCLDKKGRLAAVEGEIQFYGMDDDPEVIEYAMEFNGGDNPLDQMEIEFINEWGSDFTIERSKEFDRDKGIDDEIQLSSDGTSIGYYRFSYDAKNGDWELEAESFDTGVQAEGEITDLDKGKAMTIELDDFRQTYNGQTNDTRLLEGTYQFAVMKEKIEEPFDLESAESVFDLSAKNFEDMARKLNLLETAVDAATEYF